MYRLESDIVHPDLLPVAYRISERLKLWISAYRSPSYAGGYRSLNQLLETIYNEHSDISKISIIEIVQSTLETQNIDIIIDGRTGLIGGFGWTLLGKKVSKNIGNLVMPKN